MKSETSFLIKALYAGSINKEEFLKQYFDGKIPSENHVLHLIEQAISSKDASLVEEAIVLLYTGFFKMDSFLLFLCQLLKENWHTKHEDTAMLLKQIKSPQTVECLYDAVEIQFKYLEYDDTYQFARKCIKALSAIGNDNAVNKLKLLTYSKNIEIAGYAQKELRYIGML